VEREGSCGKKESAGKGEPPAKNAKERNSRRGGGGGGGRRGETVPTLRKTKTLISPRDPGHDAVLGKREGELLLEGTKDRKGGGKRTWETE